MNTKDETSAVQAPMLKTLSPSRAVDFKTCQQLYKFKSINKIPTEPTVYQARATTAHPALEGLFQLPRQNDCPNTSTTVQDRMDRTRNNGAMVPLLQKAASALLNIHDPKST